MRNTLTVRWYDVIQVDVLELRLHGIHEHDDIVKILQHIEMKIQHKDVQILPVLQLHENIMTYISVLHKGATMEVCHSHVW